MLEPCAVKTASTVLRGGRWQQCHPLTRYLPQTPRSSIHWWLISCGVADCDSTSTAIENLSGLPARRFQEIIPSCNTDFQQRIQRAQLRFTRQSFRSAEVSSGSLSMTSSYLSRRLPTISLT